MAWILLISTFVMAFMTYESFLFIGIIKSSPHDLLLKMIDKSNSSLNEKDKIKKNYQTFYTLKVPIAFLIGTIFMAHLTYKAFFS